MNARRVAALAGIAFAASNFAAIAAVNMPKEGNFDFNYCLAGRTETMQVSDQALAGSFELTASIMSTPLAGPSMAKARTAWAPGRCWMASTSTLAIVSPWTQMVTGS